MDTTAKRLLTEYLKTEKAIASKVLRMVAIKKELAILLPQGKTEASGLGSVTISENNTYPASAIAALLLPGQLQRVTTRKLDPAKVKSIYPAIYESVKKTGDPKVAVKSFTL